MLGNGNLLLEDGDVFAIPVLGPLSAVLGAVLPGAGYQTARKATCDFRVSKGEIRTDNLDIIGHVQIAGVPGRHEPDKFNEVNWRFIFDFLDAQGYAGWVGAEYNPRGETLRGLAWGKDWGLGAKE